MLGGMVGCGVGLRQVAGSILIAFDGNTKFNLNLLLAGPPCQAALVIQSSQTLFWSAPGPAGFARLIVEMCTCSYRVELQVALSWSGPTPWPCVEQNPPTTHLFFTAAWSWLMRRWSF